MRFLITGMVALIVAIAMVLPAGALTITTDANYSVTELFPPGVVTDQDGPNSAGSGQVYSSVFYGDGEGEFPAATIEPANNVAGGSSHGYAASRSGAAGDLAASAYLDMSDDVSSMDFHASSSWSDTITNNSGSAQGYTFDFFFAGGYLDLGGTGGMSMFSLDILLNGNSIWDASASLSGDPSGGSVTLDDGGLSHTVYDGLPYYYYVGFDPFSGSLDLGVFNDGESFDITYNLDVWVNSTSQLSYAAAAVGDPFSTNPIPEPTTMALLGMGLAGIGVRRMRRSR